MTTVPYPPRPSAPQSNSGSSPSEMTPVVVLKELAARLNREQVKTHDLLSSLGFALRSFTSINQFLELIPMVASRVTNADGGALVLFRPDGQPRLDRLHCSNERFSSDIRRAVDEASQQLAQQLAQHDPNDLNASNRPGASGPTVNWGALVTTLDDRVSANLGTGIQLFSTSVHNRALEGGRLYVFSCNPTYQWTENRQKLVRLVADQTAVAIEHDDLSTELRKKERLDRELEIGAEIQRQLLPRTCPKIIGLSMAARCQTANRVGGDYYDFIPTRADAPGGRKREMSDRDRWAIAIGDVMGKGVPAGLIMTMLRGMLRAEVLNGHSPGRVLQHLNYVMHADLENSNRFVTLFYSEYDPKTRILSYSNAAHNPPLLWRSATQALHRLDTLGMLIGLQDNSQYEDGQVQLQSGDVVIYYTDGFTDAANPDGGRFDEDNLIRSIQASCQRFSNPQDILETLFDAIQRFIGPGQRNDDDMTLIVMKAD